MCLSWFERDVGVPIGMWSLKCVGLDMLGWACLFQLPGYCLLLFAGFNFLGVSGLLCLFHVPGLRVLVDVSVA